ncbi:MAG: hypothetical protein ACOX2Z_00120 [Minisyncoccales bacterium]
MSLPRAGVRSDFRRFEELNYELNELKDDFNALGLSLPLMVGDMQTLETISTTFSRCNK